MYSNLTCYPGLGFRHYIHGNRRHHCLVLQATYALQRRGGGWALEPLARQPALAMADRFRPVTAPEAEARPGADARAAQQASSLAEASALLPFKPHADVLVMGEAVAPGGRAAAQWLAGVRVGDWSKLLRVSGPRSWERDRRGRWRLSAPEPAERVPLLYEQAYGGTVLSAQGEPVSHPGNPCGTGYLDPAAGAAEPVLAAPAIEYPDDETPPEPGRAQRVAGFGPIPMHWAPRAGRLGTVDIERIRRDGPTYPDDFDPAYWQAAPADQWVPWLARGQAVELFNLIEDEPRVAFELPRWLGFAAIRSDGGTRYPALNLDTLAIDAQRRTVCLNWRLAVADEIDRPDWIGMALAIPEALYPDASGAAPAGAGPASQARRWRAAVSRDQDREPRA